MTTAASLRFGCLPPQATMWLKQVGTVMVSIQVSATTVNFAVAPNPAENQVFSVSSNSTVSSLMFDSTTSQLKFTVSGDSGTTGYVQVCVPKNLLPVPGDLRVSLDGQDVTYQVFSQGDAWIVTTGYHHSTHSVVMALSSSTALPTNDDAVTNPTSGSSSPSPLEVSPLVTLPINCCAAWFGYLPSAKETPKKRSKAIVLPLSFFLVDKINAVLYFRVKLYYKSSLNSQ